MDGDIAKLPEIVELCEAFGVIVAVDDAHGEGVLGRGAEASQTMAFGRVDVEAPCPRPGVMGGMIAGSATLIDYIRQKAGRTSSAAPHHPRRGGPRLGGYTGGEQERVNGSGRTATS